jgi:hypothetical protein
MALWTKVTFQGWAGAWLVTKRSVLAQAVPGGYKAGTRLPWQLCHGGLAEPTPEEHGGCEQWTLQMFDAGANPHKQGPGINERQRPPEAGRKFRI